MSDKDTVTIRINGHNKEYTPLAKGQKVPDDEARRLDAEVDKMFYTGKIPLHHHVQRIDDNRTLGYEGSYEQLYDAMLEEKSDVHVQMFPHAHQADRIYQNAYDRHNQTAVVIPERQNDMRLAIKTMEEVERDPALAPHKDKLVSMLENVRYQSYTSPDYKPAFVPDKPQRLVVLYNEKGEMTRAFAGSMELKHDNDSRHFFKDEFMKHWGVTPSEPFINLETTYNAKIGSVQKLDFMKLPIDGEQPLFNEKGVNDHDREYLPTPKQAQQFLDDVKHRKLVELERPTGISDDVLLAAREAVKPRAAENIPQVAKQRSTELAV